MARLPTAENVHEDTAVPLSYFCEVYDFGDERTLKKHKAELPLRLIKGGKIQAKDDISKILEKYSDVIRAYGTKHPKKAEAVKKRWEDIRPEYEEALVMELEENQEEFELMVSLPNQLESQRNKNRKRLLKEIKPTFDKLPSDQKLKLAHYFDGYIGLFVWVSCQSDLLLNCISLMTQKAKDELRKYIENKELLSDKEAIYYVSESISWCQKIRHSEGNELRKSAANAWAVFSKKCNNLRICYDDEYGKFLGIVALIQLFQQYQIQDSDLDMVMSYALFVSGKDRNDIFHKAIELLETKNLEKPCTDEDVQRIRKWAEIEGGIRPRLERQFGLPLEEDLLFS